MGSYLRIDNSLTEWFSVAVSLGISRLPGSLSAKVSAAGTNPSPPHAPVHTYMVESSRGRKRMSIRWYRQSP